MCIRDSNLDSELKVHASRIRANYEQYTAQELCKGKDIIHAVITIVDALQFASKKLAQRENEIFVSVNGLFTTDFLRTCKTYLNFDAWANQTNLQAVVGRAF